jgi:hypothetical protein
MPRLDSSVNRDEGPVEPFDVSGPAITREE